MSFEAAHDGFVVGITGAGPAVDDNVHGRKQMLMMAKRFADETFDLVPSHGIANDARRYGESETRGSSCIRSNEDGEHRIGKATRILIDAIEV